MWKDTVNKIRSRFIDNNGSINKIYLSYQEQIIAFIWADKLGITEHVGSYFRDTFDFLNVLARNSMSKELKEINKIFNFNIAHNRNKINPNDKYFHTLLRKIWTTENMIRYIVSSLFGTKTWKKITYDCLTDFAGHFDPSQKLVPVNDWA